jgi:hypothetical protein
MSRARRTLPPVLGQHSPGMSQRDPNISAACCPVILLVNTSFIISKFFCSLLFKVTSFFIRVAVPFQLVGDTFAEQ